MRVRESMIMVMMMHDGVFKDGVNGLLYCHLVELNSGQNDQKNRDK